MAALQPVFTAAQFADVNALAVKVGQASVRVQRTPVEPESPVDIRLSDGTTVRVADTKFTLLKLMEACRRRGQSFVAVNEDVSIFWSGFAKGFIVENSLLNQRLYASFAVSYDSGKTTWVHRSLATVFGTKDALTSCGATVLGQLSNNADFEREGLAFKIFCWNYRATPTSQAPGSVLDDNSAGQLIYDWDNITPASPTETDQ